jgi:hypothetical protein
MGLEPMTYGLKVSRTSALSACPEDTSGASAGSMPPELPPGESGETSPGIICDETGRMLKVLASLDPAERAAIRKLMERLG